MALKILQEEHQEIRNDLGEELVKARNFLDEKIGDNCLNEYSKLCGHCLSRMNVLSDALETALATLSLEVEGTEAENDFDYETSKNFALMDTAMELSDELNCLKSHLMDKIKQNKICKVKLDEDRFAGIINKQYERLQQLIAMTSSQILDPLQHGDLFKHLGQTNPIETNPGQPKQSTLGNQHTDFGNQNVENETQKITNLKKQAVKMSKDHNSEIQEKRHANKTDEQRKRKRNGTNLDVLANLKHVLKSLKRRQKRNKKRRGGLKWDSQAGAEQPLKQNNWRKLLILLKPRMGRIWGKHISRKTLQNGRRPMKLREQGKCKGIENLQNRGKPKRKRKPAMTEQTHRYRAWREIALKSEATPKWMNACYRGWYYFRNTRGSSNKKKQCAQNNCVNEQCDNRGCNGDEDSYSYLEQTMYMYKYKF